jgi:cytoskeletal protein CcmA (bactofilin family)
MDQQGGPKDVNDNSLEGSSTVVEASNSDTAPVNEPSDTPPETTTDQSQPTSTNTPTTEPPRTTQHHFFNLIRHLNIYLLSFVFIFIIAIIVIVVVISNSNKTTSTSTTGTSTLSQSQLEKIANNNSTTSVGTANQILNIAASTIFSGQVLVRKDLDVAGSIKIGGGVNIAAISVLGTGTFQALQTGKFTVSGDSLFQGNVNISQALAVSGITTFSGAVSANQLTIQSLTLNGDITINHHIDTGGLTPSRSAGDALGYGGTVSVSGSDTAGTITIGTGSLPVAGCFVTVTFGKVFNNVPYVVITPVDEAASGIAYYVTRTAANFSVCTSSTPPAGQSFGFDYIAMD